MRAGARAQLGQPLLAPTRLRRAAAGTGSSTLTPKPPPRSLKQRLENAEASWAQRLEAEQRSGGARLKEAKQRAAAERAAAEEKWAAASGEAEARWRAKLEELRSKCGAAGRGGERGVEGRVAGLRRVCSEQRPSR